MDYGHYRALCGPGQSERFWDELVATHWERAPAVFERAEAAPMATVDDAVEATLSLLAAPDKHAQLFLSGEDGQRVELGRRAALDLDEGRRRAAQGLGGLIGWLRERVGSERVFAYVNRVHNVVPRLWLRSRAFLHPLASRVGLPSSSLDLDFFFGDYRVTPTRIHRDAGGFTFVIEGRKRFLVWPFEAFAEHPEVARDPLSARERPSFLFEDPPVLEEHRERAIVLEGGVGDIIYWPTGYWHVAESGDGEPSLSFTISYLESGLAVLDDTLELVREAVAADPRRYLQRPSVRPDGTGLAEAGRAQHEVILRLLDDVRDRVARGPSAVAAAVQLSSFSTADPPALPEPEGELPGPTTRLVADERFPILICDGAELGAPPSGIALVCCGRATLADRLDGLSERFVQALDRGETVTVESWVDREGLVGREAERAVTKLLAIVRWLVRSCGAFVVEP